jgi:Tfp pilus assembly protein PilE
VIPSSSKDARRFTLIELVILIVITGVLVTTTISRFTNVADRSKGSVVLEVFGLFNSAVAAAHTIWVANGSTPNTTATNGVYIGRDSKAKLDNQINEIVIGYNAIGNGSNTTTIGNTSTTANYFTGSINATTFVKSGGTSSQFLKADGSVDLTDTISLSNRINGKLSASDTASLSIRIDTKISASDTISLSNRINTKFNTTDTTLLQQKLLPAYSMVGNGTFQQANAQSIFFKDTSGTYTGSPNWTGVAPTSGTFTYRWTRIGKLVTLNITLVYGVLGTTLTGVAIPLPTDCPSPAIPSGLSSALNLLYPASFVAQQTTNGLPLGNAPRAFLRNNTGNNGFEIMCSFASSSIIQATITTQYTAQ